MSSTLHETMEIHELLNLKTTTMLKSKMFQGLVFDQDLKGLLDMNMQDTREAVIALNDILTKMQME